MTKEKWWHKCSDEVKQKMIDEWVQKKVEEEAKENDVKPRNSSGSLRF